MSAIHPGARVTAAHAAGQWRVSTLTGPADRPVAMLAPADDDATVYLCTDAGAGATGLVRPVAQLAAVGGG